MARTVRESMLRIGAGWYSKKRETRKGSEMSMIKIHYRYI